ncbi:hypothetical protein Bhyg_12280, partial [Pseudolycoriella hygida]
ITFSSCKIGTHISCGNFPIKIRRDYESGKTVQWTCSTCISNEVPDSARATHSKESDVVKCLQTDLNKAIERQNDIMHSIIKLNDGMRDMQNTDNIEQELLSNSVIINGVPIQQPDNILQIVCDIAAFLSCNISSVDVQKIERISTRRKNGQTTSHLVVFFADKSKRNDLIAAFRNQRGLSCASILRDGINK